MAEIGDIIEIKDFQTLDNIEGDILNVFHFEVTAIEGTPVINNMEEAFVEAWYGSWLTPALAMQSENCYHVRIEVNNLMNYNTEFGVFLPDGTARGGVASEYLAPSTAWSFQQTRLFRTTRNGSKRVAGVPESLVTANTPTSGALTLAAAVATRWADELVVNNEIPSISMRPVIIRKPLLVTTPPSVINPVQSVVFRGVGSQNSRKQLL